MMHVRGTRQNHRNFKKLPLFFAVIGSLYGVPVLAQDQATDPTEPESQAEQAQPDQAATELETVTVTGSLLRRREYESAAPIQIITTEKNVALGQVNPAEFLQQSTAGSGETQINHQFSGFVVEGGTGVQTLSLRGLGANRTLVLLDGQRPGPAGTRGQVGAFDLNVIPSSILQRIEIVKDGASSIYGSDAVAGVVNLITRKSVDRPELTFSMRTPFGGGGEVYTAAGATGWEFDKGSVVLAGEWYRHDPLKIGDRDYLSCSEDRIWDAEGNRIDREDRSILAGTELANCNNLLINAIDNPRTNPLVRYVPSPDGSTIGPFPGYRPRTDRGYAGGGQAYYEGVTNFPLFEQAWVIDRQQRSSVFASADFAFDNFNWRAQLLYNNRQTDTHRWRQFFPRIGGNNTGLAGYNYANNPEYRNPMPGGIADPIMPFPSDQKIDVDYYFAGTKFDGAIPGTDSWGWELSGNYSLSSGDYSNLSIAASRSGDVTYSDDAPVLNYFDPGFLNGTRMDELVDAVGVWHTGNTKYKQWTVNAVATGELFSLPAGAVMGALGAEHRRYSIDDQPSVLSTTGDLWGQSSAQVTKGDDVVNEIYGEVEIPIISGKPGFESLTFNASGRVFEYDSVGEQDDVWKIGLNWQINPAFKLRSTKGTSYRAPGLYELYLGNQTGFFGQLAIDPCINWDESSNDFLRANCAAAGIPGNYGGAGSSATVVSGGGAGQLVPESSNAFTAGVVFTPSFADFSIALDYFEYEVFNQIGQLTAYDIVFGCYGAPVYPNAFCNLLDRNPSNATSEANSIREIRSQFVNINRQKVTGYDLIMDYEREFAFGTLDIGSQVTYTKEDISQLFSSAEESGFTSSNFVGAIGRPKLVANLDLSLERNDWTYFWGIQYFHGTKNLDLESEFRYLQRPNSFRDIRADARYYHTVSARYRVDDWSFLVGIRNLFDTDPDTVSTGAATRYGNVPAFATQYDYYGRTGFFQATYKF